MTRARRFDALRFGVRAVRLALPFVVTFAFTPRRAMGAAFFADFLLVLVIFFFAVGMVLLQ
jgi:hypothetical protein